MRQRSLQLEPHSKDQDEKIQVCIYGELEFQYRDET